MRIVLLLLIAVTLALPAQAQSQDTLFASFEREVEAVPDVVVNEAMSLARDKAYLREIPRSNDPTMLILGGVHLRFEGASFVLYLHPTNHHTRLRLESQSLDISNAAKRVARAFLQDVAERSASKG